MKGTRVIPSIDIKEEKCVKLVRDEKGSRIIISEDPLLIAKFWESEGAECLHIIDLDGAIEGKRRNWSIIEKIIRGVSIPVEVGGGLRIREDVINVLKAGARWAIVGTAVIEDRRFLQKLVEAVDPSRLIVAIDSRGDRVVKRGWIEETYETPLGLAKRMEPFGLAAFLYTDVSIEGSESGVDSDRVKALVSAVKTPILYAGGISSLEDIAVLAKIGVSGAIVGSALYKKRFTLREAMSVAKKSSR